MLGMIGTFKPIFQKYNFDVTAANVVQTLSVEELVEIVPKHDGWIIGDDPATHEVFKAGKKGKLKAAVKWGIGVDNVDFKACEKLGIPITNTPNMFGNEVADIAVGYLIALARETFQTHQGICDGKWPKPRGISLRNKVVALIGYGDIGRNVAKRLLAAEMKIIAYDPYATEQSEMLSVNKARWPDRLGEADFIVVTSSLTKTSHHMINKKTLGLAKKGVRIINVGRGPIIDEKSLEDALQSGIVYSAALDVFEEEPLPMKSKLRAHPRCIFGSHNSSNTVDAVTRTSEIAIKKIAEYLYVK